MNPEISRRCSACGASIRERGALFCPECGKPLAAISESSEQPAIAHAKDAELPQRRDEDPEPRQNPEARAHPRMERTRETLHRASTVARGVIEDEVKRVEKIRHVSSVVIEEASYDPSLRFVLVALGLFIVFLILLVLSKVMS